MRAMPSITIAPTHLVGYCRVEALAPSLARLCSGEQLHLLAPAPGDLAAPGHCLTACTSAADFSYSTRKWFTAPCSAYHCPPGAGLSPCQNRAPFLCTLSPPADCHIRSGSRELEQVFGLAMSSSQRWRNPLSVFSSARGDRRRAGDIPPTSLNC